RLRHRALGDDTRADRAGRRAARDGRDLRRRHRALRAERKTDTPEACGHRRGDAGTRGAAALDGLQLSFIEPHAVALTPERRLLALEDLRRAVVVAHGHLPLLGRARLLLDL